MRIVVLDGYTLNPGDLTWKNLEALGDCTLYDRTASADIVSRSTKAHIILSNKAVLSRQIIQQLDDLQYISVLATGYNIVDVEAAREHGIPVSNVPAYSTESVAQIAFAHLLNLTHHVGHHARTVSEGRWCDCQDFCYWDTPLIELHGMTLGVVGYGRIGQTMGRLARAFGMKVIACDSAPQLDLHDGCERVDLDRIFTDADVISLHCPLTPETEKLVNTERLAMMKKSAFLINTSRGPLIDEHALADALNNGRIAGAGLDVLCVEPAEKGGPLISAQNCFITPHIAWASLAARRRLLDVAVRNVESFLAGRTQNVVNGV